ncbi:MAG: hypothetical protein HKN01_04760, partial [Acidimicrobiia bacterium]|nr:hypothetical protein [Acidimicrobiia bacterium]
MVAITPSRADGQTLTSTGATELTSIRCSWVLPDMDYDGRTGVQYTDQSGNHDDDPTSAPDTVPCAGARPVSASTSSLVEIVANPADSPSIRTIELWTAVNLPTGVDPGVEVYWDVFYPDGNFKARVFGEPVDAVECAGLGGDLISGELADVSMLEAALGSGQLDVAAALSLSQDCQVGLGAMYTGPVSLSFNEPCGDYRVEAHSLSTEGDAIQVSGFTVQCFQHVGVDVNSLDWGGLTGGQSKAITGDFSLGSSTAPTLVSVGSGGVNVGLRFSEMTNGSDVIDRFGAVFGNAANGMQRIDPIDADQTVWFDSAGSRTLCAGDVGRLDLLIHPDANISQGTYDGSIEVLVRPDGSPATCNNDRGAFGGNWFDSTGSFIGNQRTSGVEVDGPALIEVPQVLSAAPPTTSTTSTTSTSLATTTTAATTTTTTVPPATTTTTVPPTTTTTTTTVPPTTT